MTDRRVRIPADKEDILQLLVKSESSSGPFNLRADVLTFAAVLGLKNDKRIPFTESREPIRQDVFNRQGHDTVINLVAVAASKDPKVLASDDAAEDIRITIFEEYANGGLDFLRGELRGAVDPLEHLLLLINQERRQDIDREDGEFGLSRFLQ
jgi:dnd system-associated protein 4